MRMHVGGDGSYSSWSWRADKGKEEEGQMLVSCRDG